MVIGKSWWRARAECAGPSAPGVRLSDELVAAGLRGGIRMAGRGTDVVACHSALLLGCR